METSEQKLSEQTSPGKAKSRPSDWKSPKLWLAIALVGALGTVSALLIYDGAHKMFEDAFKSGMGPMPEIQTAPAADSAADWD